MIDILAIMSECGFKRVAGRGEAGDGIYQQAISDEQGYWVVASFESTGTVSIGTGFIWYDLNRFALGALRKTSPAFGRPEFPAKAAPPLYMCNPPNGLSRFRSGSELQSAVQGFRSTHPPAAELGDAVDQALNRWGFLPSHFILIPAALTMLRRVEEFAEYTKQYLASMSDSGGAVLYQPFYSHLAALVEVP